MTSRRNRIKGIANIPQRRKQVNDEYQIKLEDVEVDGKSTFKKEVVNNLKETSEILNDKCKEVHKESQNPHINVESTSKKEVDSNFIKASKILNDVSTNLENPSKFFEDCTKNVENSYKNTKKNIKDDETNNFESPETFHLSNKFNSNQSKQNEKNNGLDLKEPIVNSLKRKCIKFSVSVNASKKIKKLPHINEKLPPYSSQAVKEQTMAVVLMPQKPLQRDTKESFDESTIDFITPSEDLPNLGELDCGLNTTLNSSASGENIFQKPLSISNNAINSDTEYPLPPPSPNKTNRSRIKAIPRLAYRKASFSASESEDESRKINRIRNDSVCSTTSIVAESITECFSPQRQKDSMTAPPIKKCSGTEQTRKLAEARRDFIRRFGANKPERHKLTMMDLIFYNPDSNHLVSDEKEVQKNDTEQLNNPDEPDITENVEDPEPTEETAKSDEENNMPVPQIKIGPSGEIILDEQSLLIEREDVQKQRKEMQNTKVIHADNFNTNYGIYRRHKRSKFWTHAETLRFYKALNTIGTDFMLMCELFPGRSRRELKIKFKKEEKINRQLIDRALMQPCTFDFEDLKIEIEMEEKEMEELRKQDEEQKRVKNEKIKENQERIIEKARKRKAAELENKTKPIKNDSPKIESEKVLQKVKAKRPRKQKMSIKHFLSDSDADESDLATQSESDDDVILSRKPTRSGRLPKVVQRYEDDLFSIDYVMKKNKISDSDKPNNVEPGSIMIITEKGPNGEPVYKIYMVTPEQKATRLDLSADAIAKAIQLKNGTSAESIMTISANVTDDETEMPQENNITIPADKNVTTLKSTENCITDNDSSFEGPASENDQNHIEDTFEANNIEIPQTNGLKLGKKVYETETIDQELELIATENDSYFNISVSNEIEAIKKSSSQEVESKATKNDYSFDIPVSNAIEAIKKSCSQEVELKATENDSSFDIPVSNAIEAIKKSCSQEVESKATENGSSFDIPVSNEIEAIKKSCSQEVESKATDNGSSFDIPVSKAIEAIKKSCSQEVELKATENDSSYDILVSDAIEAIKKSCSQEVESKATENDSSYDILVSDAIEAIKKSCSQEVELKATENDSSFNIPESNSMEDTLVTKNIVSQNNSLNLETKLNDMEIIKKSCSQELELIAAGNDTSFDIMAFNNIEDTLETKSMGISQSDSLNLEAETIKDSCSQKVKLIATETEVCIQEGFAMFSDDPHILLEVNSDGSCSKINCKETFTEKNSITISEDSSAQVPITKNINDLDMPSIC